MNETSDTSTAEVANEKEKKDHTKLIMICLVVLLVFALGLGVYFYLENQKLERDLEDLRVQLNNVRNEVVTDDDRAVEEDVSEDEVMEDIEEESITAFTDQKEFSNKSMIIRYPDTWSTNEFRGGDGMATSFKPSFPVYIPESDSIVAIVSGASPTEDVLDHPENAVGSTTFLCQGEMTFKSDVSDTVYMSVEVEDSLPGRTYFVCESTDGGETFALPGIGEYALMYRIDDEKFEEDVLKIIRYSERL